MLVQGVLVGPVVKRLGDRMTMLLGLVGGTVGIAAMGWAPDGLIFILAMLPNALWGLAMPTLQSLMTRHVGEDEQGQLQGANMSVASIAGVMSPLFFGWIYSFSVGDGAVGTRAWIADTLAPASGWIQLAAVRILTDPGLAFYLAAVSLLLAALIGWRVGRQAELQETAAVQDAPLP
jgi:DHA1 family tetracycline resistance protein-like MFS transporter